MVVDFDETTALRPRALTMRLMKKPRKGLLLITGARQTGKTTLARGLYGALRYVNLDEIEERFRLKETPSRSWARSVGEAVLDEAQKEPMLFEKLKFAYDEGHIRFSVLLGSSQILLLRRIRETLAGRVFVYELWPLLLCESVSTGSTPSPPLVDALLTSPMCADDLFASLPATLHSQDAHRIESGYQHLQAWGGMPALLQLDEEGRRDWLRSYINTYLERDIPDIARLEDLDQFRRFSRLAALRSGQLLSYAELARDAGVSPGTARNYVGHLTVSYQVILHSPYFASRTKSLVKSPKLYWVDVGIWRQQTGFWGPLDGHGVETLVVSEIYKWVRTMGRQVEIGFIRTHGGLEVDLIIQTAHGVWGIEIKSARRVTGGDANGLRRVAHEFGRRWRGGIVAYQGHALERLESDLWAIPISRLLS